MGNISDRDFDTYMGLFDSMMMVARMPDLMIYLRASVSHLVDNVQQRGRSYEQNMSIDYLTRLNERYENFIHHQYKGRVLTIEVDDLDFKNSREDLAQVIRKVDRCLEDICQQPNLFNNNETK
jgi:deoxyadenosine/deoxycytidine kinase